jgi:cupin fold WbuC family metalloprotein
MRSRVSERVQLIDRALLEQTLARAAASPRRRINHNFHPSPEANPHRFLNALLRGTYCAPHRHAAPPKSESFLVLSGEVLVVLFDAEGCVAERHRLGREGLLGIDIPPGRWHTIAALSETAVCYEVKPGPWDPATDKEFAPWAPPEGSEDAEPYLAALIAD